MPWYLRKSVRVGPVRFNFSKSGIGASMGVRGLRYGIRPNGRSYVHAGGYGIYFREELGAGPRRRTDGSLPLSTFPQPVQDVTYYKTAAARDLTATSRQDLLSQLNQSYKTLRFDFLAAIFFLILSIVGLYLEQVLALVALGLGTFTTFALARWETMRRTVAITYDLSDDETQRFRRLTDAFNQLASCKCVWTRISNQHLATIHQSKLHAGAWNLVDYAPATVGEGKPPWVDTNISVPVLRARNQTLYMLPDGALLYDRTGVGLVDYQDIRITASTLQFIEERPPSDAQVIGHTWKHPNRDGTPDRRFRENYKIPICFYGELTITSTSGVSLHLITSRSGAAESFARDFSDMMRSERSSSAEQATARDLTAGARAPTDNAPALVAEHRANRIAPRRDQQGGTQESPYDAANWRAKGLCRVCGRWFYAYGDDPLPQCCGQSLNTTPQAHARGTESGKGDVVQLDPKDWRQKGMCSRCGRWFYAYGDNPLRECCGQVVATDRQSPSRASLSGRDEVLQPFANSQQWRERGMCKKCGKWFYAYGDHPLPPCCGQLLVASML